MGFQLGQTHISLFGHLDVKAWPLEITDNLSKGINGLKWAVIHLMLFLKIPLATEIVRINERKESQLIQLNRIQEDQP